MNNLVEEVKYDRIKDLTEKIKEYLKIAEISYTPEKLFVYGITLRDMINEDNISMQVKERALKVLDKVRDYEVDSLNSKKEDLFNTKNYLLFGFSEVNQKNLNSKVDELIIRNLSAFFDRVNGGLDDSRRKYIKFTKYKGRALRRAKVDFYRFEWAEELSYIRRLIVGAVKRGYEPSEDIKNVINGIFDMYRDDGCIRVEITYLPWKKYSENRELLNRLLPKWRD